MTKRSQSRLSLNRETVRCLDSGDLGGVAGGVNTAGTCPVTACVCVTTRVCQTTSYVCNIAVGPTLNDCV
jgi:hypothetical protein